MAKKTDSPDGGEQLVKEQVISRADLEEARKREEESGTPWYRQLIQMKKLNFNAVNDVLNYEFHSKGARESHTNLGDLLVEHGSLSEKKLTKALAAQKRNGKLLGTVLVEEGFVSEEDIAKALCKQYGMEYAELSKTKSERDALDQVPESVAIQKEIIPVSLSGSRL
ncbi:MAG: hypothetical protein VCC01_00465, partial [Candidatus Hydrogenedentota bacterium]